MNRSCESQLIIIIIDKCMKSCLTRCHIKALLEIQGLTLKYISLWQWSTSSRLSLWIICFRKPLLRITQSEPFIINITFTYMRTILHTNTLHSSLPIRNRHIKRLMRLGNAIILSQGCTYTCWLTGYFQHSHSLTHQWPQLFLVHTNY